MNEDTILEIPTKRQIAYEPMLPVGNLRILVACEFTGLVRDAFTKIGHDVTSCDLLPSETPGKHYQGNVFDIINDGWDLMIAHPPCTYISYAATRYWNQPGRAEKRIKALDFFLKLWEAPIEHICLENPIGVADAVIKKHDQIIHPYYFGDEYLKRTCLWLKNLPKLQYTMNDGLFGQRTATDYPEPMYVDKNGKKRHFTEENHGGHERSRSFPGIANAMAEQWTDALACR